MKPMLAPAWNPLDLPGSIKDLFVGMMNYLTKLFESIIIKPVRYSDSGTLPAIYGSGNQLALYAASWVMVIAVALFMLFFRKAERPVRSVIHLLILQALLPVWVDIANQMQDTGDQLSKIAALIGSDLPTGASTGIPVLDDVGWYILALLQLLGWGSWLVTLISGYEPLVVVFKLWFPLAFALSPIGKRTRAISNSILAVGIVATLTGRPWAIFFIGLGKWAVANLPGGTNGFVLMMVTVFSYIAALISQVVMFFVAYSVVSSIEGFIRSKVQGTTEALIKKTLQVDLKKRRERRIGQPVPVLIPLRTQLAREQKAEAGRKALNAAARGGTKVISAGLVAAGQPGAAATVHTAGHKFFAKPATSKQSNTRPPMPPPSGKPVSRSRNNPHGKTGLGSSRPSSNSRPRQRTKT